MTASLAQAAPAFINVAHRIVWATVATTDPSGRPRSRIMHPIWEFDGDQLTGWVATTPDSPKSRDLDATPFASITYWDQQHDVATADCRAVWETSPEERLAGWARFADAPEPLGYDPKIVPGWSDPHAEGFGLLRLEPDSIRAFPGTMLTQGSGDIHTWKR